MTLDARTHAQHTTSRPATAAARGATGASLATFQGFAAAMSRHGLVAQPQRMLWDPRYAHEQIALAHTTADGALRHLAVDLFHRLTERAAAQ